MPRPVVGERDPESGFVVAPVRVTQVKNLARLVAYAIQHGYIDGDVNAKPAERRRRIRSYESAQRALLLLADAPVHGAGAAR